MHLDSPNVFLSDLERFLFAAFSMDVTDILYHKTKTDSTLKSFIMFIYRDLSDQNIWPLISNIILITSENRFSIRQENINKWNGHETMKYETKIVWKIMELSNYMNPAVSWWSNL